MEKIVYFVLCGIVGGILENVNVGVFDWRFWLLLGCMCGANICGYINGVKKR